MNGQIYDLQEAYDFGLLTREEILSIANVDCITCDYLDGNHAGLSVETEKYLLRQYLVCLWNRGLYFTACHASAMRYKY